MGRIFDLIGRLFIMLAGYAAAALAASAALQLLTLPALGFTGAELPTIVTGAFMFSVPFVALFIAYFAFLPSLAVIAIAELWNLQSWVYHVAAGGVVGFAIGMMFRDYAPPDALPVSVREPFLAPGNSILDPRLLMVLVLSGMAGGLAYWLIAGRSSGNWKRRASPTSPAPSGS